jgi:hypothetical protein
VSEVSEVQAVPSRHVSEMHPVPAAK